MGVTSPHTDLDVFRHERPRRPGRERLRLILIAAVAIGLVGAFGWFFLGRFGPPTVEIRGTWLLQRIEHDGRATVSPQDIGPGRFTAQFQPDGTAIVDRGCSSVSGSYRVAFDTLRFGELAMPAVGCGYTTTAAERQSAAISEGVDAVTSHASTVSRPDPGTLVIAGDGYRLTYRASSTTG